MIHACLESVQIPAVSRQAFWAGRASTTGGWFIPAGEESSSQAIERRYDLQLSLDPFYVRLESLGDERDFDLVESDAAGFSLHSGNATQHFDDHVARLYANYFDLTWSVGIPELEAARTGKTARTVTLTSPGDITHLGATLAMANGSADYELTLSNDRTHIVSAQKTFQGALADRVTITEIRRD